MLIEQTETSRAVVVGFKGLEASCTGWETGVVDLSYLLSPATTSALGGSRDQISAYVAGNFLEQIPGDVLDMLSSNNWS
jgi:hypothetical protein